MSSTRFQQAFRQATGSRAAEATRRGSRGALALAFGAGAGAGLLFAWAVGMQAAGLVTALSLALMLAAIAWGGTGALLGAAVAAAITTGLSLRGDALPSSGARDPESALLLAALLVFPAWWLQRRSARLRGLLAAQQAVQAHRHQLLNTLLMANQDCMSLVGPAGKVIAINRSGVEQLGFASEFAAEGSDWLGWWPESGRQEAAQRLALALRGESQRYSGDCPTQAGAPRRWDIQLLAVEGPDGGVCAVLSIWRDVSAACEALRLAREARDAYHDLLLRIDDAFLALDEEGTVVFANREAEDTLGTGGGPLAGRNLWTLFPALAGGELQQACERSFAHAESLRLQFFFRPHAVWLNVVVYPSERGVALLLRDITEQARTSGQIERHRARMHLAQEIADFGDWEYDRLFGRLGLGGSACRLLGIEAAEGLEDGQRALFDAIAPDDRATVLRHLLQRIAEGAPIDLRFRTSGAGGREGRWLWLRGRMTEDETGRPRHVVGTLHALEPQPSCEGGAGARAAQFAATDSALRVH